MLQYNDAHAAGADPTKLIEELAKRKKIKTLGVSMGQGQEVIARKYVATAMAEGRWVLLQNTHLGLSYLSEVRTDMYGPPPYRGCFCCCINLLSKELSITQIQLCCRAPSVH